MVEVNLAEVGLCLEKLAKDTRKINELKATCNIVGQLYGIPEEWTTVNFKKVAKKSVEYFNGLPKDHPAREKIDVGLVVEGYNILESGKVAIMGMPAKK